MSGSSSTSGNKQSLSLLPSCLFFPPIDPTKMNFNSDDEDSPNYSPLAGGTPVPQLKSELVSSGLAQQSSHTTSSTRPVCCDFDRMLRKDSGGSLAS